MIYLLDTSALLAHYRDEVGAARVQALFEREEDELLLASVSLPEFARRLKDLGAILPDVRGVPPYILSCLSPPPSSASNAPAPRPPAGPAAAPATIPAPFRLTD